MRVLRNLLLVALLPSAAMAQQAKVGPLIHSGGAVFDVPSPTFATPGDMEFKLAFEVATPAPSPDQLNASLNNVARYLNMHARAGVPVERIRAAVVVHGAAGWEVLDDAAYRERYGVDNPNAELVRELVAAGVRVVLCGQTAASRGIPRGGLIEGVDVALSAMTAFLVLQEQGYRVNPWQVERSRDEGGVAAIAPVVGTAVFATWPPLRHALRVDPVTALRWKA